MFMGLPEIIRLEFSERKTEAIIEKRSEKSVVALKSSGIQMSSYVEYRRTVKKNASDN